MAFELSPQSDGSWTETVLYIFCSLSNCTDGQYPGRSGVLFDSAGNLYGTTVFGGAHGDGTVFKLTPSSGGWTEAVLHSFTGGADGNGPAAGVVVDSAGNLYGSTQVGGDPNCQPRLGGCGVVFKVTR